MSPGTLGAQDSSLDGKVAFAGTGTSTARRGVGQRRRPVTRVMAFL